MIDTSKLGALKDGTRSQAVAMGLLLPPGEAPPEERRTALLAEIGEPSEIKKALVRRFVHAGLILEYLEDNITALGPLTGKGRARAAVSQWKAVAELQVRIGEKLGLERQTKPVHPLDAVHAAIEEANSRG